MNMYPTPPPLPSTLPPLPSSTEGSEVESIPPGVTLRPAPSQATIETRHLAPPQAIDTDQFISSTSRDLLALIRRSQRDLANTMAGLEQCRTTTQETKRICLLLGLTSESPYSSSSYSSSSSPQPAPLAPVSAVVPDTHTAPPDNPQPPTPSKVTVPDREVILELIKATTDLVTELRARRIDMDSPSPSIPSFPSSPPSAPESVVKERKISEDLAYEADKSADEVQPYVRSPGEVRS